jgi:hypothetical protein
MEFFRLGQEADLTGQDQRRLSRRSGRLRGRVRRPGLDHCGPEGLMDRTARGEFDLDAAGRALISDLNSVEKVRTGNSGAELV